MSIRIVVQSAVALVVLCTGALVAIWLGAESADVKEAILEQISKALVTLISTGVIGGLFGLAIKIYVAGQERAQKLADRRSEAASLLQDRRTDIVRRLVGIANQVRRAAASMDREENLQDIMRTITDARLELHYLVHEIDAVGGEKNNTLFSSWDGIKGYLIMMRKYLEEIETAEREKTQDNLVSFAKLSRTPEESNAYGAFLKPYQDARTGMTRELTGVSSE